MNILIFFSLFLLFLKTNCESTTEYSTPESSSTTTGSSSKTTTGSSYTSVYDSSSTSITGSNSTATSDSSSTNTATQSSSPFSSTDGSATPDKMVAYTTKQKTIFLACCGGTFILLIALAILSGLSDTIARSRQKAKRTHA